MYLFPNLQTDLFLPRVYPIPGLPTNGVVFVPRDFLRGLFGVYGVDLPIELTKLPELSDGDEEDPILTTALSGMDLSTIAYFSEFLLAPLGFFVPTLRTAGKTSGFGADLGASLDSIAPYKAGDQGWMTVETLSIQLNTTFTPSGHFPSYSNELLQDGNGTDIRSDTQIGHDAAVCVQMYEPWIMEAYNTSTGSSFTLGIVEKGNGSTLLSPSDNIRGPQIVNTRYLNTTGKDVAFFYAHSKGVARMWETNFNTGSGLVTTGAPSATVGPTVPPCMKSPLNSIHSTGRFFHQWHWTRGIHRTVTRPVRHYPCTSQCG